MRIKTLICALVLLPVLNSCGGKGADRLTATNAAVVLGQLGTVLNQFPRSNAAPTLPVAGVSTSSVGARSATECETVTPASPVDADSDGIALEKVSTFACDDFASGGLVYTRHGSLTVRDLDDTVPGPFGGMRIDFGISRYKAIEASGLSYEYSYSGHWLYQTTSEGLTSTSEFSGTTYYKNPTSNFMNDYTYGYTWKWAIQPTNLGSPWDTGTVSFNGTFELSGLFVSEDAAGNHSQGNGAFSVTYKSRDLTYDTTCTKWYQSGSILVDDSNGTSIEIRYSCSSAKLYVNGAESDWWTP